VTVFLVRHASAGLRDNADPDDAARHLDDVGQRQAGNLVASLGDAPIEWIAASPAVRCVETVEPLASHVGISVDRVDALFEGSDIDDAWNALVAAAALAGDAVLCSHGDVIPELVSRAQRRGMTIPTKSGCAKGSIWAMVWDGEYFASGTYTRQEK
jgi:phosphohistidine phosphatase SixA